MLPAADDLLVLERVVCAMNAKQELVGVEEFDGANFVGAKGGQIDGIVEVLAVSSLGPQDDGLHILIIFNKCSYSSCSQCSTHTQLRKPRNPSSISSRYSSRMILKK